MSVSLDATATTAATSSARGIQFLIDLEFASGTLYFTTNAGDVTANGHTYLGKGDMIDVAAVGESENTADEKINLSLTIVNSAILAVTLVDASTYRGKVVRIYAQFFDATFQPAGAPIYLWRGYMDTVSTERQTPKDGPASGKIILPCRKAGMARSRRSQGLRLSDSQQQQEYAGDKFYEYLSRLIDQPTQIVTKALQQSLLG